MKTLRRLLSSLLCLILCAALLPAAAAEGAADNAVIASGSCGEKLTWSFDKSTGTLTISGQGKLNAKQLKSLYDTLEQMEDDA